MTNPFFPLNPLYFFFFFISWVRKSRTYTEADWAESKTDIRSTTGYCTIVGYYTLFPGKVVGKVGDKSMQN